MYRPVGDHVELSERLLLVQIQEFARDHDVERAMQVVDFLTLWALDDFDQIEEILLGFLGPLETLKALLGDPWRLGTERLFKIIH